MKFEEAFEQGKNKYNESCLSERSKVIVKRPEDLKSVENDSVKELCFFHEYSGKLPPFKNYPNLERISITSNLHIADLEKQDFSGIRELSVSLDYSETRISFRAVGLIELDLYISNNTFTEQCSFFESPRPIIDLHNLNNLETLKLKHTKGCEIIWPENADSVKQLVIYDGDFSNYDFLDIFSNVEYLSLSFCNISDCSFLQRLTQLSVLDLSYNNITAIARPINKLSLLNLKRNNIEEPNIYSYADEVIVSPKDELIHDFKNEIIRSINWSYRTVISVRKPNPKRSEWLQNSIDSKTDEELFLHELTQNVSHIIARIVDPSDYRNRRANLSYEELEAIAMDILPFITICRYRIEKIKGSIRYIKIEQK